MTGTSLAIVARRTGAIVLPDIDKVWTNRLQVAGSTGNVYVVAMKISDKTWGCSCRGWIGHRRCKHLTAMLPALTSAFPDSKTVAPLIKIKG